MAGDETRDRPPDEAPHEAQRLSTARLFLIVVVFLGLSAYAIWNSDRFQSLIQGVSEQRLSEILQIQLQDNVKSWALRGDGKYERVPPKAGAPLVRSQARFIEMTRDRVKAAEQSATSARFSMGVLSRPKIEAALNEGRRARNAPRTPRKTS